MPPEPRDEPGAPASVDRSTRPNRVLEKMLDRLVASLMTGPGLNCRPHRSRQRVDFSTVSKFQDLSPDEAVRQLLSEAGEVKFAARVAAPRRATANRGRRMKFPRPAAIDSTEGEAGPETDPQMSPEEKAWIDQTALIQKIRVIADDARTYEQDTGVAVLNLGFPMLSLPAGSVVNRQGGVKRVLAPIAFIPVSVSVGGGTTQTITLSCRGDGLDRVTPNAALFAWIEQQTGKSIGESFGDEAGSRPWREIETLVRRVCEMLDLPLPFAEAPTAAPSQTARELGEPPRTPIPARPETAGLSETALVEPPMDAIEPPSNALGATEPAPPPHSKTAPPPPPSIEEVNPLGAIVACPRNDEDDATPSVLSCAVLGLFPMAKQGLLRDMQTMIAAAEPLSGPVQSFLEVGVGLGDETSPTEPANGVAVERPRVFAEERLMTAADPCQSRAVRLARKARGLVIHGPPGTGKSQTIANIVGDHLARGERVLLVCDKRTALDVVADRLEHMGLGNLCGLIHDPQRDQRDLYRAIRDQLEALPDTTSDGRAEGRLAKADAELQRLHAELSDYRRSVMTPGRGHEESFHELVGHWLALASPGVLANGNAWDNSAHIDEAKLQATTLAEIDHRAADIRDLLERTHHVDWAQNPWTLAAGQALTGFLKRPMDEVRAAMHGLSEASRLADETADDAIPPFLIDGDLAVHGQSRVTLAAELHEVMSRSNPAIRARWAGPPEALSLSGETPHVAETKSPDITSLRSARQRIIESEAFAKQLQAGPLDAELLLATQPNLPPMQTIAAQLAAITAYLEIAGKWWSFVAFKPKSAARPVLNSYGLALSPQNAERLQTFLVGLRARMALRVLLEALLPEQCISELPPDDVFSKALSDHKSVLDLRIRTLTEPELMPLEGLVRGALTDVAYASTVLTGLRRSGPRATALGRLERSVAASKLIDPKWAATLHAKGRRGEKSGPLVEGLAARIDMVEGVLRVREAIAALPATLRPAVEQLLLQSPAPDAGLQAIRRDMLAVEIGRRLSGDASLQGIDGQRLKASFDRYRELEAKKKVLGREALLHRWIELQKQRMLAGTGHRLNAMGADLRRRLTLRGERALRLRQVLSIGRGIDGGDPIFDLRPVWMASPETVAQIFPREAIFDIVIFDEASQCRLEEALPVLLRGKRFTVAGDPKQLPPTRFFESTIASGEDDLEEVESDQQLFEIQQGENEDLLGAALGLDIQQCYLDVHYRSRNADLIEFSNTHFYGSRLQAIPGHPRNRTTWPPVSLDRVLGVYERNRNEAEAQRVCEIVRDLLKRADPPSIGIACFNLPQRDLIVEALDELAEEDASFGKRLEAARNRRGDGSFEGLFVKNLENVQGDERDHIIISTTYGPTPQGKFYQRFGPLGRAGGGRRLNVLVTRARREVHLVTSIPAESYRALPPVPAGQSAGGGWLLFAYLQYAEKLADLYGKTREPHATDGSDGAIQPIPRPAVAEHPTNTPSPFASAFAQKLYAARGVGSDVHWGNAGFCVDIALHDAADANAVTIGILCDASRFTGSEDPVEWDIFRTTILEGQGWTLRRLWSPHFFRDPRGSAEAILRESTAASVLNVESK